MKRGGSYEKLRSGGLAVICMEVFGRAGERTGLQGEWGDPVRQARKMNPVEGKARHVQSLVGTVLCLACAEIKTDLWEGWSVGEQETGPELSMLRDDLESRSRARWDRGEEKKKRRWPAEVQPQLRLISSTALRGPLEGLTAKPHRGFEAGGDENITGRKR